MTVPTAVTIARPDVNDMQHPVEHIRATASLFRAVSFHLRAAVPDAAGVNPYVNATPLSITLPDDAKVPWSAVATIANLYAWARSGSGTLGPLTNTNSQTPGAGSMAISPSGDLLFNQTDAFTSVDVSYTPERQDVVSGIFACTAGTGVVSGLPAGLISVLEAEAILGGVTGKCIIAAPSSSAPTTGKAGLSLGKTGVFFCIADAVTSVRLKLGVIPAVNL